MSTSLLYRVFGVRGYHYVKTEYVEGGATFTIEQPRESYRCPLCESADVIGRGQKLRRFRTLPIGGKPAYLALAVPRVECRACGAVRRVRIGFADPRVSYTKAFQRYVLELSRYMTIQDVARHLDISWDVIKAIQKGDLQRRFGRPKLKHLRQIAIDEISTAKGHRYLLPWGGSISWGPSASQRPSRPELTPVVASLFHATTPRPKPHLWANEKARRNSLLQRTLFSGGHGIRTHNRLPGT